ncbi:hypothetical protein OC842_006796 [Tilletia horrida]|uniref:Uncharacterized protein n=1 Tax=Tilletia horrida TaxID=155126 RepID=A0AAN6G9J7_9BASI|nr:hypothetical protein OC842_006796 [Tilletia horrida]
MMATRDIHSGASLAELHQRHRGPRSYEEVTADALRIFTPTAGIRHREDRLPNRGEPTDPRLRKLYEKANVLENA